MSQIPVYLKIDPKTPRPRDSEFYMLTGGGLFFCRNHKFFESDTPARWAPKSLADHEPRCVLRYPKLGRAALEYVVGFFDRIYTVHGSEAVILLFWDLARKRYRLWAPEQEAEVWESRSGDRTALDVTYKLPSPMPKGLLLVGDIHSHCNFDAYASYTDKSDESFRDGIHGVVGRLQRNTPAFHQELVIDGYRFPLEFKDIFGGFKKRRFNTPAKWLNQVKVKVKKTALWTWPSRDSTEDGGYWESDGAKHHPFDHEK